MADTEKLLYHYCSLETFVSIISNRTFRCSSMLLSNDSMEGRVATNVLLEMAAKAGLEATDRQRLESYTSSFVGDVYEVLGFCLSENGDLLSQWRGYAGDATGVSIGFSSQYLWDLSEKISNSKRPSFGIKKVLYNRAEHEECLRPVLAEIMELIQQGAFRTLGRRSLLDARTTDEIRAEDGKTVELVNRLSQTLLVSTLAHQFLLKMPAFSEEQEWRVLSHCVRLTHGDVKFRASGNKIVPYREYMFDDSCGNPIRQVILGPKNATPPYVIKHMLEIHGFGDDIKVVPSDGSYR